jgi:hypothetical protein
MPREPQRPIGKKPEPGPPPPPKRGAGHDSTCQDHRVAEAARAWLKRLEDKDAPEPVVLMVRAIVAGLVP